MNNRPMTLSEQVDALFCDSVESIESARTALTNVVSEAATVLANAIRDDHKILICGNGGSACDSLHFSGELLNKFRRVRSPLAAISLAADVSTLTSIANDEGYDSVFAKKVEALAQPGDLLVVIPTSGN